jgi:hypothetical protein
MGYCEIVLLISILLNYNRNSYSFPRSYPAKTQYLQLYFTP